MVTLLSLFSSIICFLLTVLAFKHKNFWSRTFALVLFLIALPIILFSFIEISGIARESKWDMIWTRPEKMEVISYDFADNDIYLWLRQENGRPINYKIPNPSEQEKQELIQADRQAKKNSGTLYYYFEGKPNKGNGQEEGNEESRSDNDGENGQAAAQESKKRTFGAEFIEGRKVTKPARTDDDEIPFYSLD